MERGQADVIHLKVDAAPTGVKARRSVFILLEWTLPGLFVYRELWRPAGAGGKV